jgi:hypothetical protein
MTKPAYLRYPPAKFLNMRVSSVRSSIWGMWLPCDCRARRSNSIQLVQGVCHHWCDTEQHM